MKPFTHWDVLLASPTEPLAASDVNHRVGLAEHCLLVLFSGNAPTIEHWEVCATVVNFMESFVQLGYALDPDGLVADAKVAMRACRDRSRVSGAPLGLTGAESGVLLALIEDYAECLRGAPARSAIRAMRATERKVRA